MRGAKMIELKIEDQNKNLSIHQQPPIRNFQAQFLIFLLSTIMLIWVEADPRWLFVAKIRLFVSIAKDYS